MKLSSTHRVRRASPLVFGLGLAWAVTACSAASEDAAPEGDLASAADGAFDPHAEPNAAAPTDSASELFGSLEALAGELDERSVNQLLDARLEELWLTASARRAEPEMSLLIDALQRGASGIELRSFASRTLSDYVATMDPLLEEIGQRVVDGVEDPTLVEHMLEVSTAMERFEANPGNERGALQDLLRFIERGGDARCSVVVKGEKVSMRCRIKGGKKLPGPVTSKKKK